MIDILGFGYAALVAAGGIMGYVKAGKTVIHSLLKSRHVFKTYARLQRMKRGRKRARSLQINRLRLPVELELDVGLELLLY